LGKTSAQLPEGVPPQGRMSFDDSPRLKDDQDNVKDTIYESLPTYEAVLAFDLSHVHKDLRLMPPEYDISPQSTRIGGADIPDREISTSFIKEHEVKDLLVDQGALAALSNSLNSSEGDLILVSLDTLQQLLHGNKKTREEFK